MCHQSSFLKGSTVQPLIERMVKMFTKSLMFLSQVEGCVVGDDDNIPQNHYIVNSVSVG